MKHVFKKIVALLIAVVMIIGVLPSMLAAEDAPFADVDENAWYAKYVEYVHTNGLMEGTDKGFEPDKTLSRAEATVVLYRMSGEKATAPSTFVDLDSNASWYLEAVAWAQQNEVVKGTGDGTTFEPNTEVSREMLVTMIYRYAKAEKVEEDKLAGFADAASVSDWAKEAVNWAVSVGIIEGDGTGLVPGRVATRAEYAKIINVYAEKVAHEHVWDEGKVTKEPTCTEPGEALFTCTVCGETKTQEVPPLGHAWDEGKVTKEPTCTEPGEKLLTCTVCGATETQEVPPLGHAWVDGVCTRCGATLAKEDEIVIYYTNDVHTYIDDKAMSYEQIADLKAQTLNVAAGVLLVDAGDHAQGTAYGAMDKGETIIKLMNAAKYDLATHGNHEFDYGMERALAFPEEADFPYVSANFYHEKDGVRGENVYDSYKIFEVGGKKIAIIGITTPESFTKSTPKYFQDEEGNYIYGIAGGEDGSDLYEAVQTAINEAKAENPDYIIALGHLGDDPSSKPWTSEETIANTTGLDAFIDGHSHSTVPMREVKDKDGNTVILTQTGSYFDAVGRMSITADGIQTELITEYTGSDANVKAIKDAWVETVNTELGVKIAANEVDLTVNDENGNRAVRSAETNLGDFVADALYYYMNEVEGLDVDFAIMNGGGVRANLPAGDVTYQSCKTVHTFGNVGCVMTITGQQIIDALEWGAKSSGIGEDGGFLQVSGLTYEVHNYITSTVQQDDKGVWSGPPTGEYRVKNVKVWDKEKGEYVDIDPEAKYNLAGYNYTLRDLGDGFNMFGGATLVKDYIMEDYMLLSSYAMAFPKDENNVPTIKADNAPVAVPANYGDIHGTGRITIVTEAPAAE